MAPLDWGLGHTTRCLPVIDYLLKKGHSVTLAAEGTSVSLLRGNFPGLEILPLKGYRIQYSHKKNLFAAKILTQVPKILRSIRGEHAWLARLLQKRHFDLVISDNRYGLYHARIPSIIMTHQLQIKTGMGKATDRMLQKWHYRFLEKFRECWIVDNPGTAGLAGELAHPERLPVNARYIGLLSQMSLYPLDQAERMLPKKHILILLSGPEPMRSMLEEKLLRQIRGTSNYIFTFVAGNPSGPIPGNLPPGIVYHSHLHARELQKALQQADLVICRSGYSTLMDLAWMGKKALLIPTPGQTEQEYLARFLMQEKTAYAQKQHELDLFTAIHKAFAYAGFPVGNQHPNHLLQNALDTVFTKYFC